MDKINFKTKQILKKNISLGTKKPNNSAISSLFKAKKRNKYYVNINESLAELQKILTLITQITANKGSILIYDANKHYKTKPNLKVIKKWPNGLISNIKTKTKINPEITNVPTLIIILDNKKEKLDSIVHELATTGVPYATIQKDYIEQATYTSIIPLNSKKTKNILLKTFQYATLKGLYHEMFGIKIN